MSENISNSDPKDWSREMIEDKLKILDVQYDKEKEDFLLNIDYTPKDIPEYSLETKPQYEMDFKIIPDASTESFNLQSDNFGLPFDDENKDENKKMDLKALLQTEIKFGFGNKKEKQKYITEDFTSSVKINKNVNNPNYNNLYNQPLENNDFMQNTNNNNTNLMESKDNPYNLVENIINKRKESVKKEESYLFSNSEVMGIKMDDSEKLDVPIGDTVINFMKLDEVEDELTDENNYMKETISQKEAKEEMLKDNKNSESMYNNLNIIELDTEKENKPLLKDDEIEKTDIDKENFYTESYNDNNSIELNDLDEQIENINPEENLNDDITKSINYNSSESLLESFEEDEEEGFLNNLDEANIDFENFLKETSEDSENLNYEYKVEHDDLDDSDYINKDDIFNNIEEESEVDNLEENIKEREIGYIEKYCEERGYLFDKEEKDLLTFLVESEDGYSSKLSINREDVFYINGTVAKVLYLDALLLIDDGEKEKAIELLKETVMVCIDYRLTNKILIKLNEFVTNEEELQQFKDLVEIIYKNEEKLLQLIYQY